MGCCESRERREKEQKPSLSNSYEEASTNLEQEDFKKAIIKQTLEKQREYNKQKPNEQLKQRHHLDSKKNLKANSPALDEYCFDMEYECSKKGELNEKELHQARRSNLFTSEIPIQNQEEERKSVSTVFYTPPNELADNPDSENSFIRDLPLIGQKQFLEFDKSNRKTEVRPNYEQRSEELLRSGSVPIYLKNSNSFIIPSNSSKFDPNILLEAIKQALESLQERERLNGSGHNKQNQVRIKQTKQVNHLSDLLDEHFDEEVNQAIAQNESLPQIFLYSDIEKMNNKLEYRGGIKWDSIDLENELTPSQFKAFFELKAYFLSELDYPNKKDITDYDLIRFLQGRKYNLSDVKQSLKAHLEWRIAESLSTIWDFRLTELEEVKQCYPHGIHYCDKEGRPLFIERVGMLEYTKLFDQVSSKERFHRYLIQRCEKMLNGIFQLCSEKAGKKIRNMVVIIDCGGMKMKLDELISFGKLGLSICKTNYPEILHKIFLVNSGMVVHFSWKVLQLMVSDATKKKINIFGTDFLGELVKEIPIENIPKYLGGKCECECEGQNCMINNPGP